MTNEFSNRLHFVSCTLKNGVGELILDRVDKHNAFDEVMISEMSQSLVYFAENDDCNVLVLKANGKNFSAGADLGGCVIKLKWISSKTLPMLIS